MKKILILLLALQAFTCITLSAQRVEWIKQFGGKGNDAVSGYIRDSSGNYIVWGHFQDVLTLGNYKLTDSVENSISFVARFDTLGNVLWAISLPKVDLRCKIGFDGELYAYTNANYSNNWEKIACKILINTGKIVWMHKFEGVNTLDITSIVMNENSDIYMQIPATTMDKVNTETLYGKSYLNNYIFKLFSNGSVTCIKHLSENSIYNFNSQLTIENSLIVNFGFAYRSNNRNETCAHPGACQTNASSIHYSTTEIVNPVVNLVSISQQQNYSFACNLSSSGSMDQKIFYTNGLNDIVLFQFDKNSEVLWKKQIGGKGDEQLFYNKFFNDTVVIGISTDVSFVCDDIMIPIGKNYLFFDKNGICIGIKKHIEPQINQVTTILGSVTVNDAGIGYTAGNINNRLDTLVSNGNFDFYFAKVSCKPAYLKQITGTQKTCKGVESYYSTEQYDGMYYTWETDKKSTITNNGTSSPSIRFDTTGTYIVKVTPSNSCGTGNPIYLTVEVNDKPQKISAIVGDTIVCSGLKAYSVNAVASGQINWSVTGGGSLIPDKNNVTLNWHTPGYYTLSASEYNECGDGVASQLPVLVQALPTQPASITGNTSVCRGTELYNIATEPATKYEWYLNNGGQLTGAQSKASVNWTIPGTHSLLVTANNVCGTSLPQTLSVTVKDVPTRPAPIRGEDKACVGRYVYYTDKVSGLSYNWTINGGGQLSQVENTAEVNWLVPGSFTIKVTQSNECGAGLPASLLVKILDVPTPLDSIIGLEKVCQGKQLYAVAQRADEDYKWELAGGGSLLPNGNTASINWMSAGAYTLSVSPFNQCGVGKSVSKVVTVSSSTSQVGSIKGNSKPCLTEETYSVDNIVGLTYDWKLSSGGSMVKNMNNATITWQQTGVHSITITTSDNCAVSMIAQVNDKPIRPDVIQGDDLVCLGEMTYQVTNVPDVDYLWSISGGGTVTPYSSSATVDWTNSGIYTLSVAAHNLCGNSDTSRLKVKILQAPQTPSLISGNDTVCLTTEKYGITLIPDAEYNWWLSNSGGIITANNNLVDIDWQFAHENILNVSAENLCGTSATRSLPIVVKSKPSQTPLLGDSLACTGKNVYFVHPQTETEYIWKLYAGGTMTTKNDSAFVQWTTTGNHIISVSPKNICGLGQESARSITVNTVPQLSDTIQGKNMACQGVEFYSVNAHSGIQYQWTVTSGGSLLSLGTSAKIFWTGAGKQTLAVTPYNECGAGNALQKTVLVKRTPDSSSVISGSRSVCQGTQIYSVLPVPEVNYSWNLPNGGVLSGSASQASVNWTDEGYYTLSVVPSNQCGTGPTRTINIQVTAQPQTPQFISSDTSACVGTSSTQQLQKTGSYAYNWFLDVANAGTVTANNAQAEVLWNKTGEYLVKVAASNQCGISDTVSQVVRVASVPSVTESISGTAIPCQGVEYYSINNSIGVLYDWTVSAGGSVVGLGSSAKVLWTHSGAQIVSVTPRNQCGAGNSIQKNVSVKQIPDSIPLISGKQSVCVGAQTYSVAPVQEVSYVWQLAKGGSKTDNQNSTTIQWSNEGVYELSVTPSNQCGIGASKTITVTVIDKPTKPQFTSSDTLVCSGKSSVALVKQQDGNPSYNWLLSNASAGTITSKSTQASVLWKITGRYSVLVSASNNCGNSDTAQQLMNIHTVPSITDTISGSRAVCQGVMQYTIPAQSQITYNWSVSSGGVLTSNGSTAKIFWNGSNDQNIFVVPSNECGDGAAISKKVFVKTAPQTTNSILGSTKVCLGTQTYSCTKENGVSYLWSITNDNKIQANNNTANVNWTNVGTSTINLQSQNECGLGPISTLRVAVGQKPLRPQFAQSDSSSCKNSATAHQVFAQDDCSYIWGILNNGGTVSTQNNAATALWKNTGLQTLWVAAQNYCGISDSLRQTVAVKTVPSISTPITGRVTLCLGKAEYHLYNPDKNILNWNINGGGSLLPQGDSAQVDWFTAGQYKISVTPVNECGNGNTQSLTIQTVTKPQQPDAILANTAACLGAASEFSTSAISGVHYQWICDTSGSITATNNSAKILFRQPGTHVVSLIPSNSCGQGPATTASIYVNEPPKAIAEIMGDSVSCVNNNRTFTLAAEQGVSYVWGMTNGANFTVNNNFATILATKPGDFMISVTASNTCGKVSPPAKQFRIKTVPTKNIHILGDSASCLLTKKYTVDSAHNDVVWAIDGGGVLTASNKTASVNWTSAGNYRLQAQETNQCGSGPVATKAIKIIGAPALPVDITGEISVCTGVHKQYSSLQLPEIQYQWQVLGQTADTAYKMQHGNHAEIAFTQAGHAQVSVYSYNSCGRSQSRTLSLAVQSPLPRVPFSIVGDSLICVNTTGTYTTSLVNDFNWQWMIDSMQPHGSYKNSLQVDWNTAGLYVIAATPFNACGTGDTAYKTILVEQALEKPSISYRNDSLIVETTATNLIWYRNYSEYDEIKTPVMVAPTEGNYTVQTSNSCGTSAMSDTAYIANPKWFNLSARVYPNPATDEYVTVELPRNYAWQSLEVLNSLGQPLQHHPNTGANRIRIPIGGFSRGIYLISVKGVKQDISGKFTRL